MMSIGTWGMDGAEICLLVDNNKPSQGKKNVRKAKALNKTFNGKTTLAILVATRQCSSELGIVLAAPSVAEGVNRFSVKDKAHFIEMAYGSLMEVSSQIEIAEELGYVTADDRLSMDQLIEEDARLLSGLLNSYKPSDSKQ